MVYFKPKSHYFVFFGGPCIGRCWFFKEVARAGWGVNPGPLDFIYFLIFTTLPLSHSGSPMEDIGIFYGHLVYFTVIWYMYFWTFGLYCGNLVYFSQFWYVVPKKNMATLDTKESN
jgi:hypothetical protein